METKKVAKEYLQKDILRTIFQMWYSFYTTEIGKERKAAIEDMRFKRDGWLYIEPWEIWLELTEHPENEDDRIIWYQNMHGIWKKAEENDLGIDCPGLVLQNHIFIWFSVFCHCCLFMFAKVNSGHPASLKKFLNKFHIISFRLSA